MNNKGFSLIELMIVITIIGVLAAVAVPAYQNYTIRAKLADVIPFMQKLKIDVSEYYAVNGACPANESAVGLTGGVVGQYIRTWSIRATTTCNIHMHLSAANLGVTGAVDVVNDPNEFTLHLIGTPDASGNISWACIGNANFKSLYPASCQ